MQPVWKNGMLEYWE